MFIFHILEVTNNFFENKDTHFNKPNLDCLNLIKKYIYLVIELVVKLNEFDLLCYIDFDFTL